MWTVESEEGASGEGGADEAAEVRPANLAAVASQVAKWPSGQVVIFACSPRHCWPRHLMWPCVKLSTLSPAPPGAIWVRHANYTANKWSASLRQVLQHGGAQ